MDETLEKELRQKAEENGIDPDELIALVRDVTLPDELDATVSAILGDVALFGHALSRLEK